MVSTVFQDRKLPAIPAAWLNDVNSLTYTLGNSSGASLVGFSQGNIGAVSRTVMSKLRDIINVKDYGATGDGVTDDTVAIQAAIDNNKGATIWFPTGRFVHAGLLISGTSYSNTNIVCEGELVLKTRPTSGTVNFQGGWVGLALQDATDITIEYRGDGQRTTQPAEEHCHLVAIAGGSNINFPTFQGREIRGDGVYIGQSNYQVASSIPTNITFGRFCVVNSADDGRNAMSIISASSVRIDSFVSIRVGGLIGAITQPGGFDIEPNQDFQTVNQVSVGTAFIDTAGNYGFQIYGASQGTLGGNVTGLSFGFVHIICRGLVGSLNPISFRHASNISGRCFVEFKVPAQSAHVGVLLDNILNCDIDAKTDGGQLGARIGYYTQCVGLNFSITATNYALCGCQTVNISQCNFKIRAYNGLTTGTYGLYTRAVFRVGVSQVDVDYTVHCPKATTTGTTACYNEASDLITMNNVRFIGGSFLGYASPAAVFNGFGVGVQKIDVIGISYATVSPVNSAWDVGNIVKNSAPTAGGTPGWVCTTAGTPGTWKAMANLAP